MQILDLSYAQIGLDPKTMAVHSGDFHADDVFAAALISMIYPKLKVIRTRNPDQFDTCDIVADVGLIHDPTKLRFDHHQEGRAGSRENGILYSGFGLVWQHWGLAVCKGNEDIFKSIDRKTSAAD
jgi:uncharacterized UPF0160 family protein